MNTFNVTSSTQQQAYKTTINTTDHVLIADEPIDLGGQNLGPTPGELLAASLASCTSITLKMYADRKEWNFEEINVDVEFNIEDKLNPVMTRTISIIGAIEANQQGRLLAIANVCPMHKLLEKSLTINTTFKN